MTQTVLIVGGGYVAISAAVTLLDKGLKVHIVESGESLGGLGECLTLGNNSICEKYYHHYFSHDTSLNKFTRRFLDIIPSYTHTTMAIFSRKSFHPWNGIFDILKCKLITFPSKIRFLLATILLTYSPIPGAYMDKVSLADGMKQLYGKNAYYNIWLPILRGKFGSQIQNIPLRWMRGRLQQRINSRNHGKEMLGFIPGSLNRLTDALVL